MSTVVHISTTDGTGGAARAARRLHDGLGRVGWESWIASGLRHLGGERVTTLDAATAGDKPAVASLVERAARLAWGPLGEMRLPLPASRRFDRTDLFAQADVVNLHNLHGGYFDYTVLPAWSRRKPLIWTLHDMWATTGHCAYSFDCERWESGCHDCPMWGPWRELDEIPRTPRDNSGSEWRRKRAVYAQTPVTVVAPTRWLAGIAERSILMGGGATVRRIPYGLDTTEFSPMDRAQARRALGLPPDGRIVLFSAAAVGDERKGLRVLADAFESLPAEGRPALVTMGRTERLPTALRTAHELGSLNEASTQRAAYAAADVVVLPTLADNQPLVMLEAMACGVPVVASDTGGVPETVRDGETGLLAPPRDSGALAAALQRVLAEPDLAARLGAGGRQEIVRNHDLVRQARAYADLYDELRA